MATETLHAMVEHKVREIKRAQNMLKETMAKLATAREQVREIGEAMQAEVDQKYSSFGDKALLLDELTKLQNAISESPKKSVPVIDGVIDGLSTVVASGKLANVITDQEQDKRIRKDEQQKAARLKAQKAAAETRATAEAPASAD